MTFSLKITICLRKLIHRFDRKFAVLIWNLFRGPKWSLNDHSQSPRCSKKTWNWSETTSDDLSSRILAPLVMKNLRVTLNLKKTSFVDYPSEVCSYSIIGFLRSTWHFDTWWPYLTFSSLFERFEYFCKSRGHRVLNSGLTRSSILDNLVRNILEQFVTHILEWVIMMSHEFLIHNLWSHNI